MTEVSGSILGTVCPLYVAFEQHMHFAYRAAITVYLFHSMRIGATATWAFVVSSGSDPLVWGDETGNRASALRVLSGDNVEWSADLDRTIYSPRLRRGR